MASLVLTGCSSFTTSHLILSNRPNGAFLPRRCLRTTLSGRRGCVLSVRCSSDDAAMVMDGWPVAAKMIAEIKTEVSRMKKSTAAVPGLAGIIIGDRMESEACTVPCGLVGIKTSIVRLPKDSSEEEVLKSVSRFNNDPCVHGITVQMPLPSHIDEHTILSAVSIEKDVDGFHPLNIGRLAMRGREPLFVPPAPRAYMELLHHYNVGIKGKRAVVIGRSDDFCIPLALLLQREDATVTMIHSSTKNPEEITRQADIVISAAKKPNMVRGSWIKPGAVVINVEQSFVTDVNARDGFRIVGDICYEEVCKVASAITTFKGSIELLMTSLMLLSNTLTAAKRTHDLM